MSPAPETIITLGDSRRVTLRGPLPSDAAAMMELRREIAGELAFTVTQPHECPSVETLERRLALLGTHLCIIATDGPVVVGEVNLKPGARERTRHVAELGLHVRNGYRSLGLGRALMRAAMEHADPSIEKISLAVFADNAPAVALYRSLGFHEEGRRSGQIRLSPGRYADDLLMGFWRRDRE